MTGTPHPPNRPFGDGARDAGDRFAPGGPGSPHALHAGRLRSALVAAVAEEGMREVIVHLVELAKSGEVRAVEELLDRTPGRPVQADLVERLEALESRLSSTLTENRTR